MLGSIHGFDCGGVGRVVGGDRGEWEDGGGAA